MVKQEFLDRFAHRVATMEGFYAKPKKPNPSQRNNNPGNLRSWGSLPKVDGFAKFPTVEDGFRALRRQIEINVFTRKLTFTQFFCGRKSPHYAGYAPDNDGNHCRNYAAFVAQEFGVSPETFIFKLVE